MSFNHPLITLEEHFVSEAVKQYYESKDKPYMKGFPQPIMTKLCDLDQTRLNSMKAGSISLQIISHAPSTLPLPPEVCREANNQLFEAIKQHPEHFAGFAMLPTAHPEEAAKELERCIKDLHFVGSLIDNNTEGRFYDDEFFWPIFQAHQDLDVPVYIHPAFHPGAMDVLYTGNYPDPIANFLANHGLGWHSECGLHVLRLFAAKVFDHFPHLKLIIGHMGEMLPFQLDRIHKLIERSWGSMGHKPKRHLFQVWHENIWLTTSGMFTMAPFACVIHMCKAGRVLYSVDYPFSANEEGLNFMQQLQDSGMICDEDFEKIAYRNAEDLLRVKVKVQDAHPAETSGNGVDGHPLKQLNSIDENDES